MRLKKGHIRAVVNKWDPLPVDSEGELSEDDLPQSSFKPAQTCGTDSSDFDSDIPAPIGGSDH